MSSERKLSMNKENDDSAILLTEPANADQGIVEMLSVENLEDDYAKEGSPVGRFSHLDDNDDGSDDDSDDSSNKDGSSGLIYSPSSVRFRYSFLAKRLVQTIPEPIRQSLKPPRNRAEWLNFFLMKLPIIKWICGYKLSYLIGDIIAGITVAIMHIPQGLAYALLSTIPPVYGLYTSFVPVIVYSLLGTSRHISVGTFAVIELMIRNALEHIISSDDVLRENCMLSGYENSNGSSSFIFYGTSTTCDDIKLDIVVTLAWLSGIIMIVMGLLKLGFITIFMSEPLISGYTTGAAVHVFNSQLKHIIGVELNSTGLFQVPKTWIEAVQNFSSINWPTIIVSALTIAVLIIFKIINKKIKSPKVTVPIKIYRRREGQWIVKRFPWPIPIPSQLIVVIIGTIIAYYAMLENKFDIRPIGDIPNGLPGITIPRINLLPALFLDAFIMSIVLYSVTVSLAKVFAREYGYSINTNQEFLAYGMMNVVGSLFSSFTAAGSLSRSTIQAGSGGKTQLVGLISSGIILIILVKLGSLFEPLPRAILASIIWVALYGMFKQFKDIYRYWILCRWDSVVWVVVFLSTALLGVDVGLGVGIIFSMFILIVRIVLPSSSVLGQAYTTEIFRNLDNFERVETIPGILIYRFEAPLCFVNSQVFRLRLEIACDLMNKTALKQNRNTEGCLQVLCYKAGIIHKGSYAVASRKDRGHEDNVIAAFSSSSSSVTIQNAGSVDSAINHLPSIEPIHTVIVDCSSIVFMDAVGVKTLQQIVTDFDQLGIQVLFVCMTRENRAIMGRLGFFRKCSKKWLFPSMQDAVRHAQYEPALHPNMSATSEEPEADLEDEVERNPVIGTPEELNTREDPLGNSEGLKEKFNFSTIKED